MEITNFNELWRAVNKIKIDQVAKTEITLFENEGLDTDLSDILFNAKGELFTILKDGTIRKTIVHICNIREYNGNYNLPKFHIFECRTLDSMRKNNRGYRYKKASRLDCYFWVIRGKDKSYAKLDICNNDCLKRYRDTYHTNNTVQNFNLKDYIQAPMKHPQPYITIENDMSSIPESYSQNWNAISLERKNYYKWVCQECFIDLNFNELKKYLHTHHENADITNNKHENLKVLCIACHSEQYNHGHIKNTKDYRNFIKLKERL